MARIGKGFQYIYLQRININIKACSLPIRETQIKKNQQDTTLIISDKTKRKWWRI